MDRRDFLQALVVGALYARLGHVHPRHVRLGQVHARLQGSTPRYLGEPDFDRVLHFVAGVRPYRRGGYRLEAESLDGKLVIHNYGHGGALPQTAPPSRW